MHIILRLFAFKDPQIKKNALTEAMVAGHASGVYY